MTYKNTKQEIERLIAQRDRYKRLFDEAKCIVHEQLDPEGELHTDFIVERCTEALLQRELERLQKLILTEELIEMSQEKYR